MSRWQEKPQQFKSDSATYSVVKTVKKQVFSLLLVRKQNGNKVSAEENLAKTVKIAYAYALTL